MTCYNSTSCLRAQEMTLRAKEMAQMAHAFVWAFPINSVFCLVGNNFSISNNHLLALTLFDLGAAYLSPLRAHTPPLSAVSQPVFLTTSTSYTPVLPELFQILMWLITSSPKFLFRFCSGLKDRVDQESAGLPGFSVTDRVTFVHQVNSTGCWSTKWCY